MEPDLARIGEHIQIRENDSEAKKEQKENYDRFRKKREESSFNQQEVLKKIFHKCALSILILLAACVGVLVVARFLLLLFPTGWRWLAEKETGEIDRIISYIVVGSVGSFILKYYQNNIK